MGQAESVGGYWRDWGVSRIHGDLRRLVRLAGFVEETGKVWWDQEG